MRQGAGVVFKIVVQLRVRAHLVHHQLRAGDLQQGLDGGVALVPRAAVHALHHVHHLPVVVAQVHHVAQLFGGALAGVVLLQQRQHLRGLRRLPGDGPAPHRWQTHHVVADLQHHAKVATRAAPQGPEQVGVLAFVGGHYRSAGQRHAKRCCLVTLDAVGSGGVAIAPTLHKTGHAHAAASPRGHMPARAVECAVEHLKRRAGQHMHQGPVFVQHHALHLAQVNHHAAGVHRIPRRAVPA